MVHMMLYKYLHPDRREIIEKNSFRFTQPDSCNDPLECIPRMRIGKNKEDVEREYEWAKFTYGNEALSHGATVVTKEQYVQSELQNETHNPTDLEFQMKLQAAHSKLMGILCLTKNPKKLLLWSHYAHNHTGYVVGIDSEHKWFSDPKPSKYVGSIQPVEYSQTRPEMFGEGPDDNRDDLSYLYQKGCDWAYEEEYRYILPLKLCNEVQSGFHVRRFPQELLKTLIFGFRIAPKVEHEIRQTLEHCDINYFRAEPSSVSYDMVLVKA